MSVRVRPETDFDNAESRKLLLAAFPTPSEARLVRMLHDDLDSEITLVAEEKGWISNRIVGHIMLSRMDVEGDGRQYRALGLAPVAVVPKRQRQGIGTLLIKEGLRLAEALGEELVFVVGEPSYYGRFGFDADVAKPFASAYAGPYFQAKALDGNLVLPKSGRAHYAPAFARLG